jgi:hypothetical protein
MRSWGEAVEGGRSRLLGLEDKIAAVGGIVGCWTAVAVGRKRGRGVVGIGIEKRKVVGREEGRMRRSLRGSVGMARPMRMRIGQRRAWWRSLDSARSMYSMNELPNIENGSA